MLNVQAIKHVDITEEQLLKICKIKEAFGNYTIESQLSWIERNMKAEDIHFLIHNDNKLIAYSNLVKEMIIIDNNNLSILGVGNVCVDEKGKDKGKLLILEINKYIMANNRIGLLFCKKSLIKFYEKYDWRLIQPNFSDNIYWMIFNFDIDTLSTKKICYEGKVF
ncbi:hypothetical protein B4919_02905 [Francisella tularensis subsp. novicida]|uniref:hypothetical protein n=1 Tax=Francisella tularensis TaxID=263 RepID=UPI000CE29A8D|nr:hypothetical protein [Francisella tularensis]AVC43802.1 hypothetical protein B4919_02905 [Francisella tularensis subsp. novicida]